VIGVSSRGADTMRRDELALAVDRTMSERFGVSAGHGRQHGGVRDPRAAAAALPEPEEDREINVRIRYRKEDREQLSQLLEFKVLSDKGKVGADPRADRGGPAQKGETALVRNDKRVAALIRLELAKEDRLATRRRCAASSTATAAERDLASTPTTTRARPTSLQSDLIGAAALSTVFIFLLMGFLFESFVLPLSVLPSIPLSFIGVWWFLLFTGSPIDSLAVIGICCCSGWW
jgi:HAE1 family hydrophobic/amphiphilic exporter-1